MGPTAPEVCFLDLILDWWKTYRASTKFCARCLYLVKTLVCVFIEQFLRIIKLGLYHNIIWQVYKHHFGMKFRFRLYGISTQLRTHLQNFFVFFVFAETYCYNEISLNHGTFNTSLFTAIREVIEWLFY